MKRAIISSFLGMAQNKLAGAAGEFAFSKHFDILSFPKWLKPIRGMSTDTLNTLIGNLIVASDGFLYGIGTDQSSPTLGRIYYRSSYGGASNYASIAVAQDSSAAVVYDLLVDWPDCGNTRELIWASNNVLVASNLSTAAAGSTTSSLTFASIGQGLVHPKDSKLYFPYRTTTTPFIGIIRKNGTPFADMNATLITLPSLYRAYCLSWYNNYLAVPLTPNNGSGQGIGSEVQLWDLDTTLTQPQEVIPWGQGSLQVLNNLNGVLIGISHQGNVHQSNPQDTDNIVIRAWDGGPSPTIIKTISATHLAGSNQPSVAINPRVNFIANNRLYFSINVIPNDGKQTARYGLWSVGKDKNTGAWSVTQEQVATNANTETGVIAAAIAGDYVSMVHTAEGTLTYSTNGNTGSTVYGATSVYETLINPSMPEEDKLLYKKLMNIRVRCLPLPSGAQLTLKYRIDSDGDDADWVIATTAFTTTDGVAFKATNSAAGSPLGGGYNFEFRVESTGGGTPTAILYDYEVTEA